MVAMRPFYISSYIYDDLRHVHSLMCEALTNTGWHIKDAHFRYLIKTQVVSSNIIQELIS